MKKSLFVAFLSLGMAVAAPSYSISKLDPAMFLNGRDTTVQVLFYSPDSKSGMHLAYIDADEQWHEIGQIFASDYGQWGTEKRMIDPYIARANDGSWRAVWSVNSEAPCFAVAYGQDLVHWRPQDYPIVSVKNISRPIVFPMDDGNCDIYFYSGEGKRYVSSDTEYRRFSQDAPSSIGEDAWLCDTATVNGRHVHGNIFEVKMSDLRYAFNYMSSLQADARRSAENMKADAGRFAGMKNITATLTVDQSKEKRISDKLIGVFFEDISYAADGGLYAELVQNRDFEYSRADRGDWTDSTAWTSDKPIKIDTINALSKNNPHYVVLDGDVSLYNMGWDGISGSGLCATGAKSKEAGYRFSFFARNINCENKSFTVSLVDHEGIPVAAAKIKTIGNGWQKYEAKLIKVSRKGVDDTKPESLKLCIKAEKDGQVAVDMISLFPAETFHGHGLRKDLAEKIADLHPKFMRFPGGCMSHGQGIDNIYHWTETVGPLQERKPAKNIWNYHQTSGLGFFEYFQLSVDLGCEPLPVLSAGVPCQNSASDKCGFGGQQGGIPMKDMPQYIQDLLDLIEWANGDPAISKWAKMRADAGHPAPFNLHYIGIGNEDLISSVFEERYLMICKAIKERYPDIKVCGTVGPFHKGSSDYDEGWKIARENKDIIDMVDEHYYESTGWFLHNKDYYDSYDRNSPKVYLGEYAASTSQKRSNVETALCEAYYLCNIERNGDVVSMTSYAPLLAKEHHTSWNPDMIYFNNDRVTVTPSYETQRLFSTHSGDEYIQSSLNADSLAATRIAASVVRDSHTGNIFLKLVNILPVPLRIDIHINGISVSENVMTESFSGMPDSRSVRTVQGRSKCKDGTVVETLEPYSLKVLQ